MYEQALFKAIEHFGSQEALASALNISQQAVSHWLNFSKKIPYIQALKIFLYTKGDVLLSDLVNSEQELTTLFMQGNFLEKMPFIYLPVEDIHVGDKYCPIHLIVIEEDLKKRLFHRPILIDFNHKLITCECRVRVQKKLGYKKVKVYRVDLLKALKNKGSIEVLIKNFPISERIDIGFSIENLLGNRQGKRTDLQLPQNYAEVKTGSETRQAVANLTGFGSHYSYCQAKEVFKKGIPDVIQAMDDDLISIFKASKIIRLSKRDQFKYIKAIRRIN